MAATLKPEEIWTRFAMSVFRVNGILIRAGEGITRPIGQSSARWQVLGRAYRPQTVAALARDIGHARHAISDTLARVSSASPMCSHETVWWPTQTTRPTVVPDS